MDFLKANESPLISEKVDAYLALAAFLTTMIRYFCALALRLTRGNLYLCLWMPPIGIPRPSPPDQAYCAGIIRSHPALDPRIGGRAWSWLMWHLLSRVAFAGGEMASKHYWGPGLVVAALRGWQPAICPVFCPTRPSPKSGEADRSETDFCRLSSDCKSRPGCHTSDHHTPDPAVQPKIIKGLVAKNSLDLLIYKCFVGHNFFRQ